MTRNLLDGVTAFTRAADLPIATTPHLPDQRTRDLRRALLCEEYGEYLDAENADDVIEIVDGLLDVIVIAWGTLLTYVGEEAANRAADEVTRSNLAKIVDGKAIRRADGKILKPAGWTPPDIAGALKSGAA